MNLQSKELFINMKEGDIPFWNPVYPFEEQDDDVKQFWMNEAMKLAEGLTVNGVYIHPWLYWHINFWKMMIDLDPDLNAGVERIPGRSELRDNEWFFAELLKQAEEENKGIFMFGTRRFGKALLNSEIVYLENGEKTMGEILVGDRIYDDKGKLTTVQGVYPQGKVMTYRVIFEDGRSVVCSGDHLWRVKYNKTWHIQTLKSLFGQDLGDITIQMQQPLDYPDSKTPFPPDTYAQLTANHLMGNIGGIPYNSQIARSYLRSSIRQKKIFVEEFLKTLTGVVSGEEVFEVSPYVDRKVLNFVHRMFWSYGWYAGMDGNELCLSSFRDEVKITDVTVYGKQDATCIKVDNQSHLFLTTNYIVTHNTAIMSSYLARNVTMTYNLTHNVIGASKEDLAQMTEYLEFGLDNLPPFLKINRTGNDWTKEVILGNSTVRNERDIHARIRIVNIDSGKSGAALKTAGGTPYTTIYDEVGKFPFLGPYLAGQPSHMMHGKMRGMILASGCVCAGSMIAMNDGMEKRVERIKFGDVVMGCDVEHMKARCNVVDYVKEPMGKPCYRVTAVRSDGERMKLECSFDHPFKMVGNGGGRDSVYPGYVAAIRLIPGDLVYVYSYGSGKNARYTYATIEDVEELGFQEVFNFRVGRDHNYVANGFLTHNTGGNVEKSADAQKVMNSPEDYRFIIMNYDLLNKRTTRPTWRIGKTGCFVPAQMSHAFTKHETTLDKYLGMSDAPDLHKIKIKVSDFDENTDKIKEDRNELAKKDRSLFVQRKMAYPLTVDDCFLNANVNRFPVEDILVHKNRLLEEGRPGKLVDVYQVEGKRMGWHFSEKTLASYPFQGGNIDCPVVIYEDPPEIGGNYDYTYVAAMDPYKQDKADTESLGAFYIFKRLVHINDPFAYKIVCSYVSRPAISEDFCRTCEILQEAYGAKCLMENADRMYELYLSRRNKEMLLLENGEVIANKIIRSGSRQNNKLGLSPTVPNQRMLYNTVLQYCWEDVVIGYDDDGNEITEKGVYRIPDIELLDEMVAFGQGVNTDRIIAFGHALLLAKYYDDLGFMPRSKTEEINNEKFVNRKKWIVNGFPTRRSNPFPSRRRY